MIGNALIYSAALTANFVLAHAGGWDELVLVGAPVVLFGGLLLVAKRRAQRIVTERDMCQESDPNN